MNLGDVLNNKWLDAKSLSSQYQKAAPFPHIILEDFINESLLSRVSSEFPVFIKLLKRIIKK